MALSSGRYVDDVVIEGPTTTLTSTTVTTETTSTSTTGTTTTNTNMVALHGRMNDVELALAAKEEELSGMLVAQAAQLQTMASVRAFSRPRSLSLSLISFLVISHLLPCDLSSPSLRPFTCT
jgi:hypothetical protein